MKHTYTLSAKTTFKVRFNECDPLGIVWHGNYAKYFEEGRESFCQEHGLNYLNLYNKGFSTPLIHMASDFKRPIRYRDAVVIETLFRKTDAAKIMFDYILRKEIGDETICTGSTTQVFVENGSLSLLMVAPEVFVNWKKNAEAR
ncbi:MAG: acyl-CoA thioesterase [Bacteroidetes bacterium]|nr:acyl-CoA thioesterase [Bacteroidota bacterium]